MSKSVGKIFGASSTSPYGYEKNYLNYLQNYDTSNYDSVLGNMTSSAMSMSQNLNSMPNYQFSVENSDAARQRAEEATYQSYLNKVTPVHQQQTADLETSLINRGIPVGSEAYQRAMTDLQNSQNLALQEAASQSVINGQKAYTQSLQNNLAAADFNNSAQQNYIDMIKSMLAGSYSGYDNALNMYNMQNNVQTRVNNAQDVRTGNVIGMLTKLF